MELARVPASRVYDKGRGIKDEGRKGADETEEKRKEGRRGDGSERPALNAVKKK